MRSSQQRVLVETSAVILSSCNHTLLRSGFFETADPRRSNRSFTMTGPLDLTCCILMYYSLALLTKGSVRTLVRSVEESNGAEAWRLIRSRYAPDTQNRQYASVLKIMMPWCDHTEDFESSLRAWELVIGD